MWTYEISIALSDGAKIDENMLDLIKRATSEVNRRRNAQITKREFKFNERINDYSVHITIKSENTELIPSRAISALTRSTIYLDSEGITKSHYRANRLFICSTLDSENKSGPKTVNSDVELSQVLMEIIHGRETMTINKELAEEAYNKIKDEVNHYLCNRKEI